MPGSRAAKKPPRRRPRRGPEAATLSPSVATPPGKTTTEPRRSNLPVERWSEPLLIAGFVPVARTFLRHYARLVPGLTPAEAMFVIHLIDFKRDRNPPYPSYKRLAGYMGVGDKMVRIYARRLQEKGYMRRIVRVAKPNLFDLTPLFDSLERLISKPEKPAAKETSSVL